jgi:hypothetical protein
VAPAAPTTLYGQPIEITEDYVYVPGRLIRAHGRASLASILGRLPEQILPIEEPF